MPSRLMVRGAHEPVAEQVESEVGVGGAGRSCIEVDLDQDDLGPDSANVVVDGLPSMSAVGAALSSATPNAGDGK